MGSSWAHLHHVQLVNVLQLVQPRHRLAAAGQEHRAHAHQLQLGLHLRAQASVEIVVGFAMARGHQFALAGVTGRQRAGWRMAAELGAANNRLSCTAQPRAKPAGSPQPLSRHTGLGRASPAPDPHLAQELLPRGAVADGHRHLALRLGVFDGHKHQARGVLRAGIQACAGRLVGRGWRAARGGSGGTAVERRRRRRRL